MSWLLVVSLVWAFSFGLIKRHLVGVDSSLVACIRVVLALLVFAPICRWRGVRLVDACVLLVTGAAQFGLMYVFYTASYAYLAAYEVAILTIFTPLLVCAFDDLAERRLHPWPFVAAAIATVGAGVVLMEKPFTKGTWTGIVLVQLSNACFAIGQVAYRRWRKNRPDVADAHVFAWLYAGAVLATLPTAVPAFASVTALTRPQWLTLAYLGVIASGVCFFLWNLGATRVAAGPLAVMNNAKIPLTVAVSLLFFGEKADPVRLLVGGALVVAAGVLAERTQQRRVNS